MWTVLKNLNMINLSLKLSIVLLLFAKFNGYNAREQGTDRHLCQSVKEIRTEVVDTVSFPCPRPDKCDGWWNNLFDRDCDEKICEKNETSVVIRNQTISKCCLGWDYDQQGLCSIAVCPPGCLNGGRCVVVTDQPVCQCEPEWVGDRCQSPAPDKTGNCKLKCENGGSCLLYGDHPVCTCTRGWSGAICENDIDECASGLHTCTDLCENHKGGYRCTCPPGLLLADDSSTCVSVDVTTGTPRPAEGSTGEDQGGVAGWVWATATVGLLGALFLLLLLILLVRRRRKSITLKRNMSKCDMRENEYNYDLQNFSDLGGPLYASINKKSKQSNGFRNQTVTTEERPASGPASPPITPARPASGPGSPPFTPALPASGPWSPPVTPAYQVTQIESSDIVGADNIYEPVGGADDPGSEELGLGSYLTPPAQVCRRTDALYINYTDLVNGITSTAPQPPSIPDSTTLPSQYLTPPPSTLRLQDHGNFNTLPTVNRKTNSSASLHIYEDPADLALSSGLPDSVQSEMVYATPEDEVYDRANIVSSSYSSTSGDTRQTIHSETYDIPRDLDGIRESDFSDTIVDSEYYDDTSCCSLDILDETEQQGSCPTTAIQDITEGHQEMDYASVNFNENVYAEVDGELIYSSVEESLDVDESIVPELEEVRNATAVRSDPQISSWYSNQHLSRHSEDSISVNSYADLNGDISDTAQTYIQNAENVYSECGEVTVESVPSLIDNEGNDGLATTRGGDISGKFENVYSNVSDESVHETTETSDEMGAVSSSVYSECENIAPHYDVIVKGAKNGFYQTPEEEYIGPDGPGEIYENNDKDQQTLYSNQVSVRSVNSSGNESDVSNDYESICALSREPSVKTETPVTANTPPVLMRQSTIPENVANWNDPSRESCVYVLSDDISRDVDSLYGNSAVKLDECLYENHDIQKPTEVTDYSPDIQVERSDIPLTVEFTGETAGETKA